MFYLNSSEPFSFAHEQGSSNAFIDDDQKVLTDNCLLYQQACPGSSLMTKNKPGISPKQMKDNQLKTVLWAPRSLAHKTEKKKKLI